MLPYLYLCRLYYAVQIEADPESYGGRPRGHRIAQPTSSPHRQPQHQAKKIRTSLLPRLIAVASQQTMAEKKSEVSHAEGASLAAAQKEEEEAESTCPLFMDGLPSNFADNKSLAAIASLLNDDDAEDFSNTNKQKEDKDSIMSKVELKSGGGKVQRKNRRKGSSPYNKDKKNKQDKKAASVGEAQLFLNLWKI
eukprot:scaffold29048_cov68-Skeletonema_marinoi.AAC.1